MNNSFIFFGCWNNINCEKEAIYRDVVLNCIKEFEPSTKKMFIAGDNWYNTLINYEKSKDATEATESNDEKKKDSYKYYLVDTLVSGYHILYTMNKDIYICVGNHDEVSSNQEYPYCMIKTQKYYINKLKKYIDVKTKSLEKVRKSSQEVDASLQGTEGDYANTMIKGLLESIPSIEELVKELGEELGEETDDSKNGIKLYSDKNIGVYEDASSSYIVIIINTNMSSYDYLKTVGEKIAETKIKVGNQNKRIFVMGHMPLFLDKHKKEKVPKEPKEPKAPIEPEESIELDIEEASESIKPSKKEKESKGKGEDITKLKKGTLGEDKSPILIDSLYEILAEHKCIYLCADCHNFNIMSIKNGDDKCVIQITSGTGGADPDIIKDLNEKKVVDISGYNITYYSINSYGYCKILVEKSGIVVSYNKIIAADCNNKSIDELYVYSVKNNEIEYRKTYKEKFKDTIILNASKNRNYYCDRVAKYNNSKDINVKESNVVKSSDPNIGVCYKKKGK